MCNVVISLNCHLVTERDLITVFDVITLFREVTIGYLQRAVRVRLANRGRLLLRTPGSVPFWTLHRQTYFRFPCKLTLLLSFSLA